MSEYHLTFQNWKAFFQPWNVFCLLFGYTPEGTEPLDR